MAQTLKAILQLILDAFWSDSIGKLFTFLSIIASITGYSFKDVPKDGYCKYLNWDNIFTAVLLCITCRVLWLCAKKLEESKVSKDSTYTAQKLIKSVKNIILLINKLVNNEIEQAEVLAELCNKLRDCMDKLTESQCCVSIKLIEGREDGNFSMSISELSNQRVRNVARDNNHFSRDTQSYKSCDHLISMNTAYETIIGKLQKKKLAFYRNNDVSSNTDYITSSPYEEEGIPYKSELVFGILKQVGKDNVTLKGFICIDSNKKDAFGNNQIALDLTEFIADSLFWILTFKQST
jgi:hypothetical protein